MTGRGSLYYIFFFLDFFLGYFSGDCYFCAVSGFFSTITGFYYDLTYFFYELELVAALVVYTFLTGCSYNFVDEVLLIGFYSITTFSSKFEETISES